MREANRLEYVICALSLLVLRAGEYPLYGEVREVVVGVTPACPEGFGTCWPGIYHALGKINDVRLVSQTPDTYNSTVEVRLKNGGLPKIATWLKHFQAKDDRQIALRGVEITIDGQVRQQQDSLVIHSPDVEKPLRLAPLRHKLQWNVRKARARQPESDEAAAYDQLLEQFTKSGAGELHVLLIGPLQDNEDGMSLEVREFHVLDR
jgi:hypothetical protein